MHFRWIYICILSNQTFNAKRRHKKSLGNSLAQIKNQCVCERAATDHELPISIQIYLGIWQLFLFYLRRFGRRGRRMCALYMHSLQLLCDCCIFMTFTRLLGLGFFCVYLFCFLLSNLQLVIQLLFIGFNSLCNCTHTQSHINTRYRQKKRASNNKENCSQQKQLSTHTHIHSGMQ